MFGVDPITHLAFIAASIAIVIVPGPTVTLIIANSLRHGARAGLMNVAGTQCGLVIVVLLLALGLETAMQYLGTAFDYIRIVGAAYLVWLGIKLWRSNGSLADAEESKPTRSGHFWQGFVVLLSNPKLFLFFSAFFPQFLDRDGNALTQILILGVTFMIIASFLDGAYAVLSGKAGGWLSRRNLRLVERISGTCLIGGGIWLALTRQN